MAALRAGTGDDTTPHEHRGLGGNYFKLFGASAISNLGDGIGVIAYPWLASAITRNPLLIALVAVVQRLPWLLFSLPAGVITDRHDRRRLMVGANALRAVITLAVAVVVLARQDALPGPDAVADAAAIISTDAALYLLVLAATLLLGMSEVIYDNSAQTFMPAIVRSDDLERANGRLWSIEQVANTFVGPPLAALLIAVTFSLPFFVDAATFAISAALISLIRVAPRPTGETTTERQTMEDRARRWGSVALAPRPVAHTRDRARVDQHAQHDGVRHLRAVRPGGPRDEPHPVRAARYRRRHRWDHRWVDRVVDHQRLGEGGALALTLAGGGATAIVIGLATWWPLAWLMFMLSTVVVILWNVITVSFRQRVIPDELLGRVNSVYRFFGWGMMPIGAALGGLIVVGTDAVASRELALRMPWLVFGAASFLLLIYAAPRLTTAAFAAARAAAPPS